jgi:hypothetical protein
VRLHDDELWATAFGYLNGQGRVHPELTGFVAGGRYHAAWPVMTNCDGLVSQFRIVSLFYGSKKLIHVDVYDFPFRHGFLCAKIHNFYFLT